MLFKYKGKTYPSYLKDGNAISYIEPIAKYFCKGDGLDIGGTKEWHFPGAKYINITKKDKYHAMHLPNKKYDYIISSHTLEHLDDWKKALKYWTKHLKKGGVMFLYLPDINMEYWAFDNEKHKHIITGYYVYWELKMLGFNDLLLSDRDMYWSFSVVGIKDKYIPIDKLCQHCDYPTCSYPPKNRGIKC